MADIKLDQNISVKHARTHLRRMLKEEFPITQEQLGAKWDAYKKNDGKDAPKRELDCVDGFVAYLGNEKSKELFNKLTEPDGTIGTLSEQDLKSDDNAKVNNSLAAVYSAIIKNKPTLGDEEKDKLKVDPVFIPPPKTPLAQLKFEDIGYTEIKADGQPTGRWKKDNGEAGFAVRLASGVMVHIQGEEQRIGPPGTKDTVFDVKRIFLVEEREMKEVPLAFIGTAGSMKLRLDEKTKCFYSDDPQDKCFYTILANGRLLEYEKKDGFLKSARLLNPHIWDGTWEQLFLDSTKKYSIEDGKIVVTTDDGKKTAPVDLDELSLELRVRDGRKQVKIEDEWYQYRPVESGDGKQHWYIDENGNKKPICGRAYAEDQGMYYSESRGRYVCKKWGENYPIWLEDSFTMTSGASKDWVFYRGTLYKKIGERFLTVKVAKGDGKEYHSFFDRLGKVHKIKFLRCFDDKDWIPGDFNELLYSIRNHYVRARERDKNGKQIFRGLSWFGEERKTYTTKDGKQCTVIYADADNDEDNDIDTVVYVVKDGDYSATVVKVWINARSGFWASRTNTFTRYDVKVIRFSMGEVSVLVDDKDSELKESRLFHAERLDATLKNRFKFLREKE